MASLDSKKQALLLGHALAMPVVIQTRDYDEAFYRTVAAGQFDPQQIDKIIQEIY